jgi:hypothetical protein
MKYLIIFLISLFFFAIMGIAGSMDYQDAIDDHNFYCEMVKEGTYPNYRGIKCD